ncbi:SDR family NAD(P)-dependent oxidoreductase [Streptomyces sp. NPDC059909]|uniref:SDR family NAD(P)-dependent oxidoreductase n=1 Tax=Streptomyces sp. NPDC059909 TaxID=3346998 RepID=UPI003659A136
MSLNGLKGKVVVVTGAVGGIGSAVARRLSREGGKVVLVDLDADAAKAAAELLPGDAVGVGADVSTEGGVEAYMAAALEHFGRLDAAHLNAGYASRLVPFADSTTEDFDRVISVNVRGVYLGMRAAIRRFTEQAAGGSIVVTSSGLGVRGGQMWGPYAASKHAVIGMVRSAALETARLGIRINAVAPGFTDTAMVRPTEQLVGVGDAPAGRSVLESTVPLGRYAAPDELAAAVAWLLSDESSYTTGAVLVADGGVDASAGGFFAAAE